MFQVSRRYSNLLDLPGVSWILSITAKIKKMIRGNIFQSFIVFSEFFWDFKALFQGKWWWLVDMMSARSVFHSKVWHFSGNLTNRCAIASRDKTSASSREYMAPKATPSSFRNRIVLPKYCFSIAQIGVTSFTKLVHMYYPRRLGKCSSLRTQRCKNNLVRR